MKTLSIITITYNDPEGLQNTLDSLLELLPMPLDWEHIVVDQSPEKNIASLDKIRSLNWPLEHFSEKPLGIYGAHNYGWQRAKGKYYWFLNGGDQLRSAKKLLEAISKMERDPTIDIYCGSVDLLRENKFLYNKKLHHKLWCNLIGQNKICHQAMLYRNNVFTKIGGYNTAYKVAADYAHHYEAIISDLKFFQSPDAFAAFDMSGASSDFRLAMKEFRRVQQAFSERLPYKIRMANCVFWAVGYVRLYLLKIISNSRLGPILRPLWINWQRK